MKTEYAFWLGIAGQMIWWLVNLNWSKQNLKQMRLNHEISIGQAEITYLIRDRLTGMHFVQTEKPHDRTPN